MTEDVALSRQADGPLVELAVGSGRVGIDSSPGMLEPARAGAAAAARRCWWQR